MKKLVTLLTIPFVAGALFLAEAVSPIYRSAIPRTVLEEIQKTARDVAREIKYDRIAATTIKGVNPLSIQTPEFTNNFGSGVCIDYTALLKDRLNKKKIPTELVVGKYSSDKEFKHSWLEYLDGNFVIETVHGKIYPRRKIKTGFYVADPKFLETHPKFCNALMDLNQRNGRTIFEVPGNFSEKIGNDVGGTDYEKLFGGAPKLNAIDVSRLESSK